MIGQLKILLLASLILLAACLQYPPTDFQSNDTGLKMSGVIDDTTLSRLQAARGSAIKNDTIVLQYVPGSIDDEASLTQLARYVRSNALTIQVPSDGLVASGGTDMLAMGFARIVEPGACVGVHTWSSGGVLNGIVGANLRRDDPAHRLYLDFYKDMGIPDTFYWFTLAAAAPDDIYWMSAAEINRYRLSTIPVPVIKGETRSQRARRCNARL